MISYFIKVTICWGLFYAFYALFLSKETFFKVNRWYLLATVLLGLVIPIIPLDVATLLYQEPTTPMYIQPIVVGLQDLDTAIIVHTATEQNNYWLWLLGSIYIIGVVITTSRFLHGMNKIFQLYRTGKVYSKSKYHLVLTSQAHLPFSFFNYLFWSEGSQIEETDAGNIITHEIAHINQWHSLDVLFLEILSILLWFSPPIYWYKKSLRVVHEYLADAYVLKDVHTKQYGHLLIKQAQSGIQLSLANHFLSSQLKKRIQMMTKDESKREALMKYLPALPLICLMLLVFTNPEVRSNVDATARISLNLTGTSSVPNISLKSLWWTMRDFDKERVKTILREAYTNHNFVTFINHEPSEKERQDHQKGQSLKEMHKACIFLAEKYPDHRKEVQALTIEIAKEFGYALRFHANGESIIFQSLNPVVKAKEATPHRWTIINDKVFGYANVLDIMQEQEINYIEFISAEKAMKLYGKEEGKDGAVIIKSDYWEVIKNEEGHLLQRKEDRPAHSTYHPVTSHNLSEAFKNGYFTVDNFSMPFKQEAQTVTSSNSLDSLPKDLSYFQQQGMPIYVNGLLYEKEIPFQTADIATVDILKGMKAQIKYGEKGKNGVIEIQLKEGVSVLMNGVPNVEEVLFADDGVSWGAQQLFDGQHWDGQKKPGSYTLYTDTYHELRKEPITYTLNGIAHQLKEVEITKVPKNKDPIQITVSDYNKELSIPKSRLNNFLGLARANSTIYFEKIKLSDGSEAPSFSIQLVNAYHLNNSQLENFIQKFPTLSNHDFKDNAPNDIGIFLSTPCKEKEGKQICRIRLSSSEIDALDPSEIATIEVNTDREMQFMYGVDVLIYISKKN